MATQCARVVGCPQRERCSGSSCSLASQSEIHGLPLPVAVPRGSALCCQARPQGAEEPTRDLGELEQASRTFLALRPHKQRTCVLLTSLKTSGPGGCIPPPASRSDLRLCSSLSAWCWDL